MIGGIFPVAILPPGQTPSPRVLIHSTETISPIAIKGATETPEANPKDGKCLSINSGVVLDTSEFYVIPLREYSEDVSGPSYYRIHLLHDADSTARNCEFDPALIMVGLCMIQHL